MKTEQNDRITPLPWVYKNVFDKDYVFGAELESQCVTFATSESNAKHIVHAVNILPELIEALDELAAICIDVDEFVNLITGSPNTTTIKGEIESKALSIGHYHYVMNHHKLVKLLARAKGGV